MTPLLRIFLYIFPAIVLFAVLLPQYFKLKWRSEANQSLLVKGLCTLVPIVFCLNGCLVNDYIGFWWILGGLAWYLVGDVMIEKILPVGALAFMLGHGCLIAAFLMIAPPVFSFGNIAYFILAVAVLLFATFIAFRKPLLETGIKSVFFLLYAAVISSLLVLAFTLPYHIGTVMMLGGAVLFALSDFLLARNTLYKNKATKRNDVICLYIYYAGLYLFALSVWM